MEWSIRLETPADYRAAEAVTREAFWNVYKPGCNEHYYLHLLRCSPAFLPELTFLCEADGVPAGHIACSSSRIDLNTGGRKDTITFGPLSVLPAYQKLGMGRRLVCHALRSAAALGHKAVIILGDPRHYGRYGFFCGERWSIALEDGRYLPGLQALELTPGALENAVGRFREGFVFQPSEGDLARFDAQFPVKEKAVTVSQTEFQVMCGLAHEVIPNGFMQYL